jgi:GNAT superfamily N-acetyltransferase
MKQPVVLTFSAITAADLPALTDIMTRAFTAEYQPSAPHDADALAAYTTDTFFCSWLEGCSDIARYKILADDMLIGASVVWQFEDDHNVLGLLFVEPAYQNHGIGQQAWQFLASSFPATKRWTVRTPAWSCKNRHFYEQCCGFQLVSVEDGYVVYENVLAAPGQVDRGARVL